MPSISVIVTTYQRPLALARVLESLQVQKVAPTEIVIADDGSAEETAELVKSWQRRFTYPLIHTWQPDEGFRAASARNKAVAASQRGLSGVSGWRLFGFSRFYISPFGAC